MSQCDNILAHLQSGKPLTKAECFMKGWGCSLNSRVAELRKRPHVRIDCVRVNHQFMAPYYVYSMPPNARMAWHMEAKRKREIKT